MLSHTIYVLQALLDRIEVKSVLTAKIGNYPWVSHDELYATLQYDKSIGSIYASFNAPRFAVFVDVHGTEAMLRIDLFGSSLV